MWKRVFRWDRGVLLMALLAIAMATNPDEQHFVKFVQEYTQRGLGFLPGPVLIPLISTVRIANLFTEPPFHVQILQNHRHFSGSVSLGDATSLSMLCWCRICSIVIAVAANERGIRAGVLECLGFQHCQVRLYFSRLILQVFRGLCMASPCTTESTHSH